MSRKQGARMFSGVAAVAATLCVMLGVARVAGAMLIDGAAEMARAPYSDVDRNLITESASDCNALHPNVLIYNRVPKAGSTSMKYLLFKMAARNGFQYVNKRIFDHYPNTTELVQHFNELCTHNQRCVYVNHMRYPPVAALESLTQRNLTFAFMNIVRRPLAQSRSHFEFVRFSRPSPALRRQNLREFNGSFSECVHDAHYTCGPQNLYFKFFTHAEHDYDVNHEDMDTHITSGTLVQSIVNIKSYAVVGLVERWLETVAMFERILPDFFDGVVALQKSLDDRRNTTPKLTHEAKEMFQDSTEDARRVWYHSRFNIDNALYDYMATRFNKKFDACGLVRSAGCATDEFLFEME